MCYSAQVIQLARKLHRQLGIRLDYDDIEKLFFRRLDDPSLNISRGFAANFDEPSTDQERRIKAAIDEHRSRLATKLEKDLFSQKTRLVNAERSLKDKETKKAREDVRISTTKIETLSTKLTRLRSTEPNEEDNRIDDADGRLVRRVRARHAQRTHQDRPGGCPQGWAHRWSQAQAQAAPAAGNRTDGQEGKENRRRRGTAIRSSSGNGHAATAEKARCVA
jgi:hypothetical protein